MHLNDPNLQNSMRNAYHKAKSRQREATRRHRGGGFYSSTGVPLWVWVALILVAIVGLVVLSFVP